MQHLCTHVVLDPWQQVPAGDLWRAHGGSGQVVCGSMWTAVCTSPFHSRAFKLSDVDCRAALSSCSRQSYFVSRRSAFMYVMIVCGTWNLCMYVTARVCFVQPLEARGELTQTRCNAGGWRFGQTLAPVRTCTVSLKMRSVGE